MDGLIGLLIILGISSVFSSNKKKKQQQRSAAKQRAFRDAAEAMQAGKKPYAREEWKQFLSEMEGAPAKKPAPAAEIAKPAVQIPEPAVQPAAPAVQAAKPPVQAASAEPLIPKKAPQKTPAAPAPLLYMDNDAPEGSISTQGESAAEHAMHRQKILAREEAIRREHEALQEVRSLNLKKLRTAVVMSEVLGKPVSLRPRR